MVRRSIGFKLMLGFILVLGAVGVAVGIILFNFQKVRQASAEARKRQWIREQAQQIATLAQQMVFIQTDFIRQQDVDRGSYRAFQETFDEVDRVVGTLRKEDVDPVERRYLEDIEENARQMYEIFFSGIVSTKIRVGEQADRTGSERAALQRLHARSRQHLQRINAVNERLGRSFTGKIELAENQAEEAWGTCWLTARVTFGGAAVLCLLIVYYTRRAIMRPVRNLLDATHAVSEGDLDRRIEFHGSVEFQQLAESFNRMTERLHEHQRRLIQVEKLAGIGRLAAGIAHEINNPLAVILGYVKIMLRTMPEDHPDYEAVKAIEEETLQCKRIIEGLLDLSRPTAGAGEIVDVEELIDEVLAGADMQNRTEGIRVHKHILTPPVKLDVGRARLKQVAVNMLNNAFDAARDADEPQVTIRGRVARRVLGTNGHDGTLVLEFEDNGPGMDEKTREHLFEPFFTTKSAGTGLGLAVTYSILRTCDGHIAVDSEPGRGTRFVVELPTARRSA